jgi:YgiT-type zinc finger domain-containing protein
MDIANSKGTTMKCTIEGCPGEYEDQQVVHTVRHRGQVIVIDQVPAEVCTVCGDVLLKPETVRRLEKMLKTSAKAKKTAPLFDYV